MSKHIQFLTAVRQARYAFDNHTTFDRETRVNQAVQLAEWGVFSNVQIARFTGLHPRLIAGYTNKTDLTGGRLPGEALTHILDAIVMAMDDQVSAEPSIVKALEAGAGPDMLARLTGLSKSRIIRARVRDRARHRADD